MHSFRERVLMVRVKAIQTCAKEIEFALGMPSASRLEDARKWHKELETKVQELYSDEILYPE